MDNANTAAQVTRAGGAKDSGLDPYITRHLDAWLEKQIGGDTIRAAVRSAMLALVETDPEYYGAQSWWNVYDAVKGDRIVEGMRS